MGELAQLAQLDLLEHLVEQLPSKFLLHSILRVLEVVVLLLQLDQLAVSLLLMI